MNRDRNEAGDVVVGPAFSALSSWSRVLWAKSDEATGHGLLAHLLDVAAVAQTILEREPGSTRRWAAEQFGVPLESVACWVAALAGLHDFGKGIPGFQAKWPEGMQADMAQGLCFPNVACGMGRHDQATASLLRAPLLMIASCAKWWAGHAVQAVSAHHGYHFLPDEVNSGRPLMEPAEWGRARQEILQTYWQVLQPSGSPALDELTLPAVNWLAGLTSAADWIASNPEWFPLGERHDDLGAYYKDARHLAVNALNQAGWQVARPLLREDASIRILLNRITGREGLVPRPLQQAGDRLLADASGPSLLLVEAPMGEGKTELAFLAHLRLQAANDHRGLYMALPTQATGNAMFKRTLTFLESFFDGGGDVQLVHGGAAMNEDAQGLRAVSLRGVNDSRPESLSASAWFSQRRRPLLSPYGVGTVDQALYSVLNVKHHFVRLWGLGNRVVVLDEVHAYDTYTHGLIAALLRWLRVMRCSVVLMSATLPRARRDELLRAWGLPDVHVPELAYPRLLLADAQGVRGEQCDARSMPPIHLRAMSESLDELAKKAEELLVDGGCGAVIVNTVDRAQKLYLELRQRLGEGAEVLLMHARFPADERAACEKRVLNWFGPQGGRPASALLIATQVAEQSLDIDFDFMISDLAPVDLLLQRAGRLHRHVRERPKQHAEACLWVTGLQQERLPELKQTAWGYVYDAYILGRTWALLGQEQVLDMPRDIDRLVQAVYGDAPLPDGLEAAASRFIETEAYGAYLARIKLERQQSINISIDPDRPPQEAYRDKPRGREEGEGLGLENRTRLGQESIVLIPVEVVEDSWQIRSGVAPFEPYKPDEITARQLYARQIKVSRREVIRHFKDLVAAGQVFERALLQNFYALPLQQGRYRIGDIQLRLDVELGLVYESVEGRIEQGTGDSIA